MNELYRGIVRGRLVELEDEALLPEGTRVMVIPEGPADEGYSLDAWLQEARKARAQLPLTSDSVEILFAGVRDTLQFVRCLDEFIPTE